MAILAIETSSDMLGVAVVDEVSVLASIELLADRAHAAELPVAVQRALLAAGQTLETIDGLAIDIGPGSFTGLRIGLAFVKAIAFRTGKPVVAVPSLDVLAAAVPCADAAVCPIVDAKQRKLYAAVYRSQGERLAKQSDYHLLSVDELFPLLGSDPVIFLGNGIPLYRQRLADTLGARARFLSADYWLPRVATLGRLALERLRAGRTDHPGDLAPMYLHLLTCTVRKAPAAPFGA